MWHWKADVPTILLRRSKVGRQLLRAACSSPTTQAVRLDVRRLSEKAKAVSDEPTVKINVRIGYVLGALIASGAAYGGNSYYQRSMKRHSPLVTNDPASTAPLGSLPPPVYDLSKQNINGAREEFVTLLGAQRVNDEIGTRIAHSSTEWSPAPHGDNDCPCLVVYPNTTGDVSEIAKICHRRRIPMIAFAGGTSLEATLAAVHGELCIDFSRMNKIIALHKRDMDIVVQPGVGYMELNDFLAEENLFFPPDPGPGAQIGGMISMSCSGPNAYRWGTVKDWVLGLTVVLADGTVIKTRHRPRKSSSGYSLTQLMVGSEGTLGFITEASLKVTNKPENMRVATATFPSIQAAVDVAVKIVQNGVPVAAVELLDDISIRAVNNGEHCSRVYKEGPTLFLRFCGTKLSVKEQIEQVQTFAKSSGCTSFQFSKSGEEAESLWQARKTVLWSLMTLKNDPSDKFISSDVAVPISRMAEIIETTHRLLRESGLVGNCLGHVGDGNFHAAVFYNEEEEKKAQRIIREIQRLGIEMDGTVTGEHGIGLEYRDMLVEELGVGSVDAMRKVKLALDPRGLLNPDKMFRITAHEAER